LIPGVSVHRSPLGCKFRLSISYDRNGKMTRRNRETVLEKENRYENSRPGYDRGGCFVN
jgi:hypothetical protein